MRDIPYFKFWCQKVIPLVYDESLSYYETLCKIVRYLNAVIHDVNQIPEYIDSVIEGKLTDDHLKELINELFVIYKHIITPNDDGDNTTASRSWDEGTWLWLGDNLYITTRDIVEGNAYVFTGENANVKTTTIEERTNMVYYPNDKRLSLHANISDYSEIVTAGDYHVYNPTRQAIEIVRID